MINDSTSDSETLQQPTSQDGEKKSVLSPELIKNWISNTMF